MKKILKTAAMILILVMISNSFTGCILIGKGSYASYDNTGLAIGADILLLHVIALFILWAVLDAKQHAGFYSPDKTGIQAPVLSDQIEQSMEIFNETLKALPKTQVDTLTQKVQTAPETEKILLMETFNGMSQTRMISLMNELNTLSGTELNNTIGYLNSLSETQINTLLKSVESNGGI